MKFAIALLVALAFFAPMKSKAAVVPIAPVAVVIGAGATIGGAVMTFYFLQPTWRCWSELDDNGIVLTNYCSTLARCKQDDEHKCAGPNFKSKSKCQRICSPAPGVLSDDADDPEYTLTLESSPTANGSEGWLELGRLEVEMNSEFPQITIPLDRSEPQRFFRVRVDLLPAGKS